MKQVTHITKVMSFDELSTSSQLEAMKHEMKWTLEHKSLAYFIELLSDDGKKTLDSGCRYVGDTEETTRKFYPDGIPFTYSERGNTYID